MYSMKEDLDIGADNTIELTRLKVLYIEDHDGLRQGHGTAVVMAKPLVVPSSSRAQELLPSCSWG